MLDDTAVLDAPTPTETPAPAAIAQPSESPRPTSMRAALEQANTPPAVPIAATPDGAATVPAVEGVTPEAKPAGPVPLAVHHTALANARTKAVEEFKASHPVMALVEQLPPQAFQQWTQTAQRMVQDKVGFARDYLAEVKASDPQAFARLQAELGEMFQPAAADPMPAPDVQIVDAQGQVTGRTYSAEQLAKRDEWRERNLMAKVNEQLTPVLQEREQRLQTQRETDIRQKAEQSTETIMGRIDKILDGNKDLYAKVDALMASGMDAIDAAFSVRDSHVAPNLAEQARLAAIETQKKKAAGTTANGAGSTASPARPRTAKELAAFMAQQDQA